MAKTTGHRRRESRDLDEQLNGAESERQAAALPRMRRREGIHPGAPRDCPGSSVEWAWAEFCFPYVYLAFRSGCTNVKRHS
jgi:hypothetical protein